MKTRDLLILATAVIVIGFNACQQTGFQALEIQKTSEASLDSSPSPTPTPAPTQPPTVKPEADPLKELPKGEAQFQVLCSRPTQDKVRKLFCNPAGRPAIKSLTDLQKAVGFDFYQTPLPTFALTAHSSSLIAQSVSAINPRAVIFSEATSDFVVLTFARGHKFAEIVAGDPVSKNMTFYLVSFNKECDKNHSCSYGDLLTPEVEKNWTSITVYDDEDLKNTILDCRHCHQPNGRGTSMFLRMQELERPWTHWMLTGNAGGRALLADFRRAHGNREDYAGIPAKLIDYSNPTGLEALVKALGFTQPNQFPSAIIEEQVKASSPNQPEDNSRPGTSAEWEKLYATFKAGNAIAPPYHDVKVTDPKKLDSLSQAYADVMAGLRPLNTLPDIREIFPDDQELRARMGFAMRPGLDAQGILMTACAQCHNSKLDQSLTRAKFNVDLSKMTREQKDKAIERIKKPQDSIELMPPRMYRSLTTSEIEKLEALLSR